RIDHAGSILRVFFGGSLLCAGAWAQTLAPLRPPAVPLIAHDPYFSVWSLTDRLSDGPTRHWTGKPNTLTALIRIDGKLYRVMDDGSRQNMSVPALEQRALEVLPTRTIYSFDGAGLKLDLTFLTPALTDDLDVLSRPLTYLEWNASSSDGKTHDVAIYFEA